MEQKNPIDEKQLQDALNQFQNQTPLNLTNQDKKDDEEEDPQLAKKLQEEYQKFMKEMQNNTLGAQQSMEGLANALGGLLEGLGESFGLDGKQGQSLKNMFNGAGNNENMQDMAGKLLQMFMKKDLLYQPLLESKKNYEEYFEKNKNTNQKDMEMYKKQYQTIKTIINVLDNTPQDKDQLMNLFEQMQNYGNPPPGIMSVSFPGGLG